MPLPPYATLDELIAHYAIKLNRDSKNMERVKKFYTDEKSFDELMEKLMKKDLKRFEKRIGVLINEKEKKESDKFFPTPWKFFFIILEIVQAEGTEIPTFDTLTRCYPSKNMLYMGWTFSLVHGDGGTLISIFNRKNELVYRF